MNVLYLNKSEFVHEVGDKKNELRKNNRYICVTRISNPANRAKITFETDY
jgi:hypothetical protein